MSGFNRFIFLFLLIGPRVMTVYPLVRTFDHFIYVDYVTTSKKVCYHIKTCTSDFLLPHQNFIPGAMFRPNKKII